MTPAEILDRAADIMDLKGQCKTDAYGIDGSLCIIAATREAIGTRIISFADGMARYEAFDEFERLLGRGMVEFNSNNDKDTVTSTMRAVAATLRASHGMLELA